MNQSEERRIYGWDYPPGAALDPAAPYNQPSTETEWACQDCYLQSNDPDDFFACRAADHYIKEVEHDEYDEPPGDEYEESLISAFFKEREGA